MPPNRSQAFKLCSDDDDLEHVSFAGKQVESWTWMPAFVLFVFVQFTELLIFFLENHMSISRQPRILLPWYF